MARPPAPSPRRHGALALLLVALLATPVLAAGNGKLQIHHMKIGQGDGTLLISPNGQTALFDDGVYTDCTYIKTYLQGLGLTTVDYHFLSHYHADHLGCLDDLAAIGIVIGTAGYDRGNSYSSGTYTTYVNTLGAKRTTIAKNQVITLDAGSANPVTVTCVDLNGAGVYSVSGSDENAKSAVYKVSYGAFDEVIGGDLTGSTANGNDVETTVGPEVGDVEVYKVHHHGSRYSSNDNWLNAVAAEVGIIMCGDGNTYGHPTLEALTRMHNHNIHTYWTETGAGAAPDAAWDKVANGTVTVEVDLAANNYRVTNGTFNDTYAIGSAPPPPINTTQFPSTVTMLQGSVTAGSVASLGASDNTRMSVGAALSGGSYATNWYGEVVLAHPPLDLTVKYEGNFTVSRTQTIFLWNWSTSAWDQKDAATVSTTDVTRTFSTTTPGNYVSPTGQVRCRVSGNTRTSSYTCRGDLMSFQYNYAAGTIITMSPELYATLVPEDFHEPYRDMIPQARLLTVETHDTPEGVRLEWTTARNEHMDGFNVYRQQADGSLTLVGQEAVVDVTSDDIRYGFTDKEAPAGENLYVLGARACVGEEGRVGPLRAVRTAAVAAASRLALLAGPNPTRAGVHFALTLAEASDARLDVYDVTGRRVATPFAGRLVAGTRSLDWDPAGADGKRLKQGVYFARFEAAGRTSLVRLSILDR